MPPGANRRPCSRLRCVCLQTNNPRKLDVLTQLGVAISGRIPCQVQAGEYNQVRQTRKHWRVEQQQATAAQFGCLR